MSQKTQLCFDSDGHLPSGIHDCTVSELAAVVVTNKHRLRLWDRLQKFFGSPLVGSNFAHAYIGGSFLSTKTAPADIDVILGCREPWGPLAIRAMEPFFTIGLPFFEAAYCVHLHFFIDGAPAAFEDFRAFFQMPKDAQRDASPADRRRGLARIDLAPPLDWPYVPLLLPEEVNGKSEFLLPGWAGEFCHAPVMKAGQ